MRVYIPIPSLAPHGGIRVIIDIANWLAEQGHHVRLHPLTPPNREQGKYWRFSPKIGVGPMGEMPDRVLITSPHSIHLARPYRSVVHLQMLEHMFRPNDPGWALKCEETYQFAGRLLSISRWNIRELSRRRHRSSYMGNGVCFQNFPIVDAPKKHERPTVLVEGWNAYNPAKDVDRKAPAACQALKQRGYRVVGFGGQIPVDYHDAFDAFFVCPDLEHMNELYEEAWVLLKASRYDARSCAPVEAMTKGTPTVRLIREGDDDLTRENSIRLDYDKATPSEAANVVEALLEDQSWRIRLMQNGYEHLKTECCWDRWGSLIESALQDPTNLLPLDGELPLELSSPLE